MSTNEKVLVHFGFSSDGKEAGSDGKEQSSDGGRHFHITDAARLFENGYQFDNESEGSR